MGRDLDDDDDEVPDGPPPNISWPTPDNFYVKWNEPLGWKWNLTAASLAAAGIQAKYDEENHPKKLYDIWPKPILLKKVKKHFAYLKRLRKIQQDFELNQIQWYKSFHSCYSRKRSVRSK